MHAQQAFVAQIPASILPSAMASDLKELVKDCLGPLPRVYQEQVLLDMERARMTAEDARAVTERWYSANARMANRVKVSRDLIEEARQTAITAAESGGTRENFRVALINVNNTLVDARRATDGTDSEMESESDQESDTRQDEMETETESNTVRVPRTSFCEVCDNYWDERTVVWYDRPFAHEGRNLYSACYRCRSQMGHNFEHINVNFIVDARRATDGTNSEMESESDQESDTRQSAR